LPNNPLTEAQIITDLIGVFGLLITFGVLLNAFRYQGQ
jgi:hypothetical protein